MSVRDIILVAVIALSVPMCFLRPAYGIVLWTVLGFLNPQAFCWGIARQAPLAQAVAIPTIAGFLFKAKFQQLFCREMLLLAILWLWFTLTTFNSVGTPELMENAAGTWFRWGFVSKILLMTAIAVGIVDTREKLRWMLLAIGGSFAILVLHALLGIVLTGGQYRIYGPDNSMIADNNAFGLAVNMSLPFFFFLAKTEPNRLLKRVFAVAFLAAIPVCFFTYSRGALVGLIAVSACMLLLSNQKLLLVPIALVACFFLVFLAPQKLRDRMSQTTNTGEASARSRFNSWGYSWNLAKAYPMMGGGFDAFTPPLYAKYAADPRDVHGPHSIYFGVLAEHGFIGFGLYFLLIVDCLLALGKIIRTARLYDDDQTVHYANMLRFGLVGFLTSGAFLGLTYFDYYFAIVACVAILRQVSQEQYAAVEEADEEWELDAVAEGSGA